MKEIDIKNLLKPFNGKISLNRFELNQTLFDGKSPKKDFMDLIKENVEDQFGVYLWVNKENDELLYVGMSGKIKNDGEYLLQKLPKRLTNTRNSISSYDEIKDLMTGNNFKTITFYIIYTPKESKIPPAYLEALFLFDYFKINKRLPRKNKLF